MNADDSYYDKVLLRASDSLSARYSTSTETARGFLEEEEDVKHSAFPPPPEHILSRLGSLELLDAFSMERCEETDTVQTERKNLLGPETRALGLEFRMEKSENECSALESASLCQDGSQSRLVLPSVPIPLQSTETAHSEAKGLKEMDLATQVYFLAQRLGITEKQLLTQKAFMMSNNSTEFDTETPQRALIQIWRKRVYALLLERVSMKAAASKERSDWASERSALDKENARLSRQIADNSVSQYQLHQRLKDVESREAASQVLEERLLAVTKRLERSVLEFSTWTQEAFSSLESVIGTADTLSHRLDHATSRLEFLRSLAAHQHKRAHQTNSKPLRTHSFLDQKKEASSLVGGGGEGGVPCITAEAFPGDETVERDEALPIEQGALDRLSALSLLSQELLSTAPPQY